MYIKHLKKLFNFLTHIFSLDETEKYCPQETTYHDCIISHHDLYPW